MSCLLERGAWKKGSRFDGGKQPVLTRPDGKDIVLSARQNVPLLHLELPCAPAADDGGGSQDPAGAEARTDGSSIPQSGSQDPAGDVAKSDSSLDAKDDAPAEEHFVLHIPKHPKCDACQRAKCHKRQ